MTLPSDASHAVDPTAAEQMEKIICDLGRMYHERNEALQEVARAYREALFHLAMAAEYKDDDTGVHIVRIGFLAEALALYLGQSRSYALLLRKAAPVRRGQDRYSRQRAEEAWQPYAQGAPSDEPPHRSSARTSWASRASHCSSWPQRWRLRTMSAGTVMAIRGSSRATLFPCLDGS